MALEVRRLTEDLVGVGLCLDGVSPEETVLYRQSKAAFVPGAAEPDGPCIGVHVLLAVTLPAKYFRLLFLAKTKEEVVAVPEESMRLVPVLCTVATKDPATLIFHYEDRVLHVAAPLIHRDQTAAVYI